MQMRALLLARHAIMSPISGSTDFQLINASDIVLSSYSQHHRCQTLLRKVSPLLLLTVLNALLLALGSSAPVAAQSDLWPRPNGESDLSKEDNAHNGDSYRITAVKWEFPLSEGAATGGILTMGSNTSAFREFTPTS